MIDHPEVAALLPRCTFPPSRDLHCAVSGGPDSTALLVLAVAAGARSVTAHHVDHGLRPGSAAEAVVVARLAERLGARFGAVRAHVAAGPNLEARARTARREALPQGVLWGHTMDDQAETVLLALLRGAGPAGLGGMDPRDHPLLGLRRQETVGLCAALGFEPVADPTNAIPVHRRNRVRHEVLPHLADVAERDVVPVLARAASHQRDVAALLSTEAAGVQVTDAAALAAAPRIVAGEAVRAWWREETGCEHPPDAAAVARVLAVAAGDAVAAEVTGGWRVARRHQRLRLVPPPDAAPVHR